MRLARRDVRAFGAIVESLLGFEPSHARPTTQATVCCIGEFDHIAAALWASPLVAACVEMATTNDFSRLDRNAAKRHHFLPQFLLRGFAHRHKGKACLFQMETASRRAPLRVDVRTAASRHRLYTGLDKDGQLSKRRVQDAELVLGRVPCARSTRSTTSGYISWWWPIAVRLDMPPR